MKLAIWLSFALLALVWTSLIWALTALARWVGESLETGGVVDWAAAAGTIRFPGWITWWIDPSLIGTTIDAVVWMLELVNQAMPWFTSVAGWLVAVLWSVWIAGTLLLVLMAGGLHALASRSEQIPAAA